MAKRLKIGHQCAWERVQISFPMHMLMLEIIVLRLVGLYVRSVLLIQTH